MANIYNKLRDLHKKLNRFDVQKDAKPNDCFIQHKNINLFLECANALFGEFGNYTETETRLTNDIFRLRPVESYKISKLVHYNVFLFHNKLPQKVTYAFQDAGCSPSAFSENIQNIITPGSYIDPASKEQGKIYYGFDINLSEPNFYEIGFDSITLLNTKLNDSDKTCIITLNLILDKKEYILKVKFNSKFTPIEGHIKYFQGNCTKNDWFNNNTNKSKLEGMIYILIKELGDTIQAYYAKLYLDSLDDNLRDTCCLFTPDYILRLRCILLKVPVVTKDYKDKTEKCFYDDTNKSMADEIKKMHLENSIGQNTTNINIIKEVIKNKYFYADNNRIIVNTQINNYLLNIIKTLENINNSLTQINKKTVEEYRQTILKYKSTFLFTNDFKIYTYVKYLFPGLQDKNDPIAKTNMLFGEKINSFLKLKGGMNKIKNYPKDELYNIDLTNHNTYSKRIDELMEHNNSDALKLCLFYNFSKLETEYNIIIYNLENLYNILYNYYDYMALTSVNDDFIMKVIEKYNDESLFELSFEEFELFFNNWYEEYQTKKNILLNTFNNTNNKIKNTKSKTRKRKLSYNKNNNLHKTFRNSSKVKYIEA